MSDRTGNEREPMVAILVSDAALTPIAGKKIGMDCQSGLIIRKRPGASLTMIFSLH